MAILNQYNYYYINSFNNRNVKPPQPDIRPHGGWPGTGTRKWDDKIYWYIEFVNGDAFYHFPIHTLVNEEILNKMRTGEITLCISHVHEAYHYVIEDIYKDVVLASNIPAENILYLTNSADINLEIDYISQKYNLPKIKSEFISLFELVAKHESEHNQDKFAKNSLSKNQYDKKFITLNGLWRPHRLMLVSLLEALDITKDGYVSLNACPSDIPTMDEMFDRLLHWNENNDGYNLLLNNKEKVKKLDRLYIDTKNNEAWNGAVYSSADKQYYEDTYFSIITETLCIPEASAEGKTFGRAISEKTFKPILNLHPFMIVGIKGALGLLKQLGYKTFSPMIDESYDNEPDSYKRIYMIAKEAERLTKLSDTELKDFLDKCKPIVEYNYNHLQNKDKFNYPMT